MDSHRPVVFFIARSSLSRFLVVDDHALVRRGLVKILAESFPSAEFAEASDTVDALALVRDGQWDIILVDLNLPGRDGLALLGDLSDMTPHPYSLSAPIKRPNSRLGACELEPGGTSPRIARRKSSPLRPRRSFLVGPT